MTNGMLRAVSRANPYRGKTPTDPKERFWRFVLPEPNSGCWLWMGTVDQYGYAKLRLHRDKALRAHIISYEIHYGAVPEGLVIDHLCRVRSCVNPKHLEAVTAIENTKRGNSGKNSADKQYCPKGHPFSDGNIYINPRGSRECRMCRKANVSKYRTTARQIYV